LDYTLTFEELGIPHRKNSFQEVIMSIESARAFVEKMRNDLEFKNRILGAKSAAKRKKIIKSEGFDFKRAHLDALVSELTPEERAALMLL
jgi:predicted ribosomally synthesized peptide with nif11-like leader